MTVILLLICIVSVIWIVAVKNTKGKTVNIISNGITVWTGELDSISGEIILTIVGDPVSPYVVEGNFPQTSHYNVVRITREGACIIDSDCRTHICIHEGITDSPAKPVVCLPNKLMITVTGESTDTDAITY